MLDEHINRSGPETQDDVVQGVWPDLMTGADIDAARLSISLSVLEAGFNAAPPVKTFGLRDDGTPYSTRQGAQPARGDVSRHDFIGTPVEILHSVAKLLGDMKSSEVLIPVPPSAKGNRLALVTKEELAIQPGTIARTKEHFPPVAGPALLPLDFDAKIWPAALRNRVEQAGGVLRVLETVCRSFGGCAFLKRASSSAGIRDRLTGRQTAVDAGHHWYFLVQDGRDISRFVDVLHQRLIIAGFGCGFISQVGLVLPRSLVDVAASSNSSRLWFEGPPILDDDRLEFVPDVRRPVVVEADRQILDTHALPDLAEDEKRQFEAACSRIKTAMSEEARPVRAAYEERRIAQYVGKGKSRDQAERLVRHMVDRQELYGDVEIRLDDGSIVSVNDILEAPELFHKKTCADPLEWDYGSGQNLAVIHTDRHPYHIFSHAHGGTRYALLQSPWLTPITEDPDTSAFTGEHRRPGPCIVTGPIDPKSIPVRRWLVQPRLPIGDVAQLVGEPGAGKSTFALLDALAVATGDERILRGAGGSPERLHRSGAVIVYNAEDRADEMERRLAAFMRHYGVEHLPHPIILWSGVDHHPLKILKRKDDRGSLEPADGRAALSALVRKHNAALVILDPQISLCAGAVENSNDDADAIMQSLAVMASEHSCSILVIHHTSKATRDSAGDMGAGRGGFAAVGKVRSAFTLCRVTGEREDEIGWSIEAGDDLIRLDYAKVSHDAKPPGPIVFRRRSVPVGNGAGVDRKAADAFFDHDPAAALRAIGDRAPVLEHVDVRMLAQKSKAASDQRLAIARIAYELLRGRPEIAFPDVLREAEDALRSAEIADVSARDKVTSHFTRHLREGGVTLEIDGRSLQISMDKRGGDKSPWMIKRHVVGSADVFA